MIGLSLMVVCNMINAVGIARLEFRILLEWCLGFVSILLTEENNNFELFLKHENIYVDRADGML